MRTSPVGAGGAANHILGVSAAAVTFLLDQGLKLGVTQMLSANGRLGTDLSIVPFFSLNLTANHGISMGFLTADTNSARWLLVLVTAIVAVFVAWWMWRERARDDVFALGLVLGGALGNILDRVRLGYVIDYADFHIGNWRPFLIFNLADAAITIGVLILLARALLLREKTASKESR